MSNSVDKMLLVLTLLVQVLVGTGGNAVRNVATSGLKEGGGLAQAEYIPGTWNDDSGYSARIHGGSLAQPAQFKYSVHIYSTKSNFKTTPTGAVYNKSGRGICTGTIISPKWVLTAAHCISCQHVNKQYNTNERYNIDYNKMKIKVGCVDPGDSCTTYTVDRPFTYNGEMEYSGICKSNHSIDVALLRMKGEIKFNKNVGSTALMSGSMPYNMSNCIAQGFGIQKAKPLEFDRKLYHVNVTAGGSTFCKKLKLTKLATNLRVVCAYNYVNPVALTCGGDSGSALLCPNKGGDLVSVGVLSGGIKTNSTYCGTNRFGKKYFSTGYVETWIKTTTNDPRIVFRPL